MPSRMATIATTTISSVTEKPFALSWAAMYWRRGRTNRYCVTSVWAIRRTACRAPWAVGPACT